MKRWIFVLPILAFGGVAFFLYRSLYLTPAQVALPSALIDKPAPPVSLPPIDSGTPNFSRADLAAGHVTVVNFFASWCIPCHEEADEMMALSRIQGITLYGINYEEHQDGAGRGFLDELGNPFSRIVDDRHGQVGIDWGVDGVPETFVVDGKGVIRFKLVGPLTDQSLKNRLLPEIEKAQRGS